MTTIDRGFGLVEKLRFFYESTAEKVIENILSPHPWPIVQNRVLGALK